MRGVVLELIPYDSADDPVKEKKYKATCALKSPYFVVLREIDENHYLVSMCRETTHKGWTSFATTKGNIYINTLSFLSLDKAFCAPSEIKLLFSQTAINDIYKIHNERLMELKKKRSKQKRKKKSSKTVTSSAKIESMTRRKSYERIEPPQHLQWAAKHPYQGGGFFGK